MSPPYGDRARRVLAAVLTAAGLAAAGCSPDDESPGSPAGSPDPTSQAPPIESGTTSGTTTGTTTGSRPPRTTSTPEPTPESTPGPTRVRLRGIDASHHQGAIDWRAVADDGIAFAYLKATEGTTYTDPTFADHRAAAQDLGIRVGGYHYFQLCSSGAEQATHLASVVGDLGPDDLPAAVDLELAGSCSTPPPRGALLAEVRAFLDGVEAATGREPVVYLYPEFEEAYRFARALTGYRQWVRSLDGRPDRPWWVWQQTDSGSVAGIAGPVDVNVMWSTATQGR